MKIPLPVSVLISLAGPIDAKPVDLTGMSCIRESGYGQQTWEFYGDVAIRYYGDGSISSLPRVGEGAYERYDREGEWAAVYLFFDVGEGVQVRILSRPGLIAREENRAAPLEKGIFPFDATCVPIWERQ